MSFLGDLACARRVAERYIANVGSEQSRRRMQANLAAVNKKWAARIRYLESMGDEIDPARSNELRLAYLDLGVAEPGTGSGELSPVAAPFGSISRGRFEEAVATATRAIEEFPDYFVAHTVYSQVLSITRRDAELAAYFQHRYDGDLERYATLLRPSVNVDPPPFEQLAQAMIGVGNDRVADEALRRWRFTLDIFRAGGGTFLRRRT